LILPSGQNAKSSSHAGLISNTQAHLPQPVPSGLRVSAALKDDVLVISVMGRSTNLGAITDFVPSDAQVIENSAKPAIQTSAGVRRISIKKSEQLDHPVARVRGLLISGDKAYNVDVPVTPPKTSENALAPKHS
jgi:hypothetical protein